MRPATPLAVLALVTALDATYGRFAWSWLAGPVAAAVLLLLDRAAHEPAVPAPVD